MAEEGLVNGGVKQQSITNEHHDVDAQTAVTSTTWSSYSNDVLSSGDDVINFVVFIINNLSCFRERSEVDHGAVWLLAYLRFRSVLTYLSVARQMQLASN